MGVEEFFDTGQLSGRPEVLVAVAAGDLFALPVQHPRPASHVSPAQLDDTVLPVPFLSQQLVDLIVQVADLELTQSGILDLGHFPG